MHFTEKSPVHVASISSFNTFRIVLLLCLGMASVLFLFEAARFLPVTADNMYPEAAGVLTAQRWAHGAPLYEDYRQPPYLITPFPPAWYAVLAGAARLGLSDLDSLTLFGRVFTLTCLFVMLGLGYAWNRRVGVSPGLAMFTPAFYLSLPILIPWAITARPDFPATLCAFVGLYLIGRRQNLGLVFAAACLAAIAFLMRHNAVAVPVAIVLWLVFTRKIRLAAIYCAVWAAIVGATFAAFQTYSHGLLRLSLSGATFGTFSLSYIRDLAGRFITAQGHGFAVALFAFGAFGLFESLRHKDEQTRLMCIYCLVSLGFALLGTAARGAAVNHFLEPAFAMALLIPSGLVSLKHSWKDDSAVSALVCVLVVAMLLPSLDMQRSYVSHNEPENLTTLLPLVTTKIAFTDVPYLSARSSTMGLVEPVSLMNTESAGGRAAWSSRNVASNLEQRSYDVVVLSSPAEIPFDPNKLYPRYAHLHPRVQNAVARNYRLCFKLETGSIEGASETRYVYAPLQSASESQSPSCRELESLAGLQPNSEVVPATATQAAKQF